MSIDREKAAPARIATLDAVRGVAVMGILLLNIVSFALPAYAYVDPHFAGGAEGANWWSWAIVFVLADGKMRGLFTMLFGASTVLVAERALASGESPARVHYARAASLFAIGLVHAYLIWAGDILTLYAVCGALAFVAWRWPVRMLASLGALLLLWQLALGLLVYNDTRRFEAAAATPHASAAVRAQWKDYQAALLPPHPPVAEQIAIYRGDWNTVTRARAEAALEIETQVMPWMLPETFGLMLLGMALFRAGFFSGGWARRHYWAVAVAGAGVTIPLYVALAGWMSATHFDPILLLLTEPLHLTLLRPALAVAEAALVILFVTSGRARWLAARLTAAGRMAFSNYLGTSIVCTLIFYGYGLGWFGQLERWQLYPVVFAIWIAMLGWSQPWLERFAYGPAEWLWRSLARGRWQSFRRI
ncbi:DUF418 domain-containing protein [Sphingomonas lycopersici]|uniref:DUF418 domain-containing protein n=1 Tax=Sphingomonas lycopersici TaxID=2951807 RepID=A0AA42CRB4_9SPHN|nr:DUF418 domain-containing protein [Sphingomonas lycopersici]MCW6535907.1 DUF418 domain-containing protein [Sphingomonas lycopersici]